MGDIQNLVINPAAIAFLSAFLATPLVIALAWKIGIIDDPAKHKHIKVIHTYPVPRGGGLAILVALVIGAVMFLPMDRHLKGIIAGAVILTVMGILDDKFNLNPYLRFGVQVVAALMPVAAGIGIAFLSNPFGGIIDLSQPRINFFLLGEERSVWILADLFAVFWIVALMNFINMGAKGVDGQLSGVVAIAATTIAGLSLQFSADITQWPVIILASITAGAYLGFLPWHIYPQKIMPSFSGSNLAGYMLGILAILSLSKVGTLMIVLAVPLIDTGYTIIRRVLRGKSPFWGDRGHLHHKLLDLGWGKAKVALFYWIVTAALGFAALSLNSNLKLYTMVGVTILIGGILMWLTYRPQR